MKLPAEVERYGMRLPELLPAAVPTSSGGAGSALSDGEEDLPADQGMRQLPGVQRSTGGGVRGGEYKRWEGVAWAVNSEMKSWGSNVAESSESLNKLADKTLDLTCTTVRALHSSQRSCARDPQLAPLPSHLDADTAARQLYAQAMHSPGRR